jgi:hypothetical protein
LGHVWRRGDHGPRPESDDRHLRLEELVGLPHPGEPFGIDLGFDLLHAPEIGAAKLLRVEHLPADL